MDKGILKKFDQAMEKNPGLEEILQFHRDILKEQIKVANKLKAPEAMPTEKQAEGVLLKRIPLVKEWPVKVEPGLFESLFVKLAEILQVHRPETAQDVEKITNFPHDYQKVINAFAAEEHTAIVEIAQEIGVNEGLYSFLVFNTLRPFYIAYAEAMHWLVKDEAWVEPSCPVCGTPGRMGKLEGEGGKRSLYCSLCDTVWKFKRLECPYCRGDHEDLRYLEIEGSNYQIDVCLKCKGYIKTLDARELNSQPYLLLEDMLTMHLDLLAQKEGYSQDPDIAKQ